MERSKTGKKIGKNRARKCASKEGRNEGNTDRAKMTLEAENISEISANLQDNRRGQEGDDKQIKMK